MDDVPIARPAGWYPADDGGQRFWDGRQWSTASIRATEPTTLAPEEPGRRPSALTTPGGRTTFVVAGSILAASAVAAMVSTAIGSRAAVPFRLWGSEYDALPLLASVLFAVALVIFAWGLRGEGSVVARRPVGVISLTLFGVWNLLLALLAPPILEANPGENLPSLLIIIGLPILQPIVGIIAAGSIVRARAVPGGLRWAPLVALVPYLVLYVVLLLSQSGWYMAVIGFPYRLFGWAMLGAQLVLGVIAVVSALRSPTGPNREAEVP